MNKGLKINIVVFDFILQYIFIKYILTINIIDTMEIYSIQKANNEMARNLIELQFRSLARKSELAFPLTHVPTIYTLVERIDFY